MGTNRQLNQLNQLSQLSQFEPVERGDRQACAGLRTGTSMVTVMVTGNTLSTVFLVLLVR